MQQQKERQIGLGLLLVGGLLFLSSLNGMDGGWLWLAVLAAVFLVAHNKRKEPGFAVPAGILSGVAAGVLLDDLVPLGGASVMLGLAGGFFLITQLEPKTHAWALWPAAILAAIAALTFVSAYPMFVALAVIAAGLYVLRQRNSQALPSPIQDQDAIRYDRLAAWRAQQAISEAVPANQILSDDQLRALCQTANQNNVAAHLQPDQATRYATTIEEVLKSVTVAPQHNPQP